MPKKEQCLAFAIRYALYQYSGHWLGAPFSFSSGAWNRLLTLSGP